MGIGNIVICRPAGGLKKRLNFFVYAVLLAWRTIGVMRPLVLRLLLRDYAQAAGVWKTDTVNL